MDANSSAIFHHPFTMVVSGSTGSGKTEWVMRLIRHLNTLIDKGDSKSITDVTDQNSQKEQGPQISDGKNNFIISTILYCYGEINKNVILLKKLELSANKLDGKEIRTFCGVPTVEMIHNEANNSHGRLLLILDDLMGAAKSTFLDTIFALGSHNWGMSVILVTQHLFGKELRIARNNTHYIVLLRNPSGALQIRNLATQLFPGNVPYFMEAFADSTRERFSYLLIDMHPHTNDSMRLKCNIYPDEGWTTLYLPKHQT